MDRQIGDIILNKHFYKRLINKKKFVFKEIVKSENKLLEKDIENISMQRALLHQTNVKKSTSKLGGELKSECEKYFCLCRPEYWNRLPEEKGLFVYEFGYTVFAITEKELEELKKKGKENG